MVSIKYDIYRDDRSWQKCLDKTFRSMEELADWMFGLITYDYTEHESALGFCMVKKWDSGWREGLPWKIQICPSIPHREVYWIRLITDDGRITFSDGTLTGGRAFWTEGVRCWMRANYDRQMDPVFPFAEEEPGEEERPCGPPCSGYKASVIKRALEKGLSEADAAYVAGFPGGKEVAGNGNEPA